MPKKRVSVAVGTWPTPEGPISFLRPSGFRFESFFLDQLRAAKTIDGEADLDARFRLNVEAVRFADSLGYFTDRMPEVCRSESPPLWCRMAGGVIIEGSLLLVEALVANGMLALESRLGWLKICRGAEFLEFAPTLLRQVKAKGWSAQKVLDVLDLSYPIPGSDLDRHCREHPEDPICWVAGTGLVSARARNLARELVLVSLLQQEKLISAEQTKAIYDVTYMELTPRYGLTDLPIAMAAIIAEGLGLDPKHRAEILSSLGSSPVGLIDPDSPWAEKCMGEEPPPICHFMSRFPVATALTTELVKHKIWSERVATDAWSRVQKYIGGGVVVDY
jgi:hypothetical protein